MLLPAYLGLLQRGEAALAASLREVGAGHRAEADVFHTCGTLAEQCDGHGTALRPFVEAYGETDAGDPEVLAALTMQTPREGSLGLLRDLHDLFALASFVELSWTMVQQAASALRDQQLTDAVSTCSSQTQQQLEWLKTRMKQAAPQTLVVASA